MDDCDTKELPVKGEIFRCRKCRLHLFSANNLELHGDHLKGSVGNHVDWAKCSSWFLQNEDMIPWIKEHVEEAYWTEGKLYCPKCKSRIGAFDFIHGVQCNCGQFVIPATWIQKSRVDCLLPESQLKSIRKPPSPTQDLSGPSVADQNSSIIDLKSGCDQFTKSVELSEHDLTAAKCEENRKELSPAENIIAFSQSDRKTVISSTEEFSLHTSDLPGPQKTDSKICLTSTCEVKSSETHTVNVLEYFSGKAQHLCQVPVQLEKDHQKSNHILRPCELESGIFREAAGVFETSPLRGTVMALDEDSRFVQRSKRRREIKCDQLRASAYEWGLNARQGYQVDSQQNSFNCLTIDEGFKSNTLGQSNNGKAVVVDFQDHHSCPVCLDLLYEPFKCSCGHVFCEPCLRQLNFSVNTRTLRCPLCRQIVKHVLPATDLKKEITNLYDPCILRKRQKAERQAPYRKWPLPSCRSLIRRHSSRAERRVTLPCVVFVFLACACVYSVVMTVVLSYLLSSRKSHGEGKL